MKDEVPRGGRLIKSLHHRSPETRSPVSPLLPESSFRPQARFWEPRASRTNATPAWSRPVAEGGAARALEAGAGDALRPPVSPPRRPARCVGPIPREATPTGPAVTVAHPSLAQTRPRACGRSSRSGAAGCLRRGPAKAGRTSQAPTGAPSRNLKAQPRSAPKAPRAPSRRHRGSDGRVASHPDANRSR